MDGQNDSPNEEDCGCGGEVQLAEPAKPIANTNDNIRLKIIKRKIREARRRKKIRI